MRIIGVVDLAGGRAVHARAGRREEYAPVTTVAGAPIAPGDALALAGLYRNQLGLAELYVADLDAIGTRHGAMQQEARVSQETLVAAIAGAGPELWLDAGVTSPEHARQARGLGATRVVVGLETLTSYEALSEICVAVGGAAVAFSLDLRAGQPVLAPGFPRGERPEVVAARAAGAGVHSIIVIDLARVGTGAGLDLALIARLRAAVPAITLLAGGGVRGLEDLSRLRDTGCDGALVATALHDGRIGAAEIATLADQPSGRR